MSSKTKVDWPPCLVCGAAITDTTGVLSVNSQATVNYETAVATWKAEHPERVLPFTAFASYPEPVPWVWSHSDCIPSDSTYQIAAARIDTPEKALQWTLHLMDKDWFAHTGWDTAVYQIYPARMV